MKCCKDFCEDHRAAKFNKYVTIMESLKAALRDISLIPPLISMNCIHVAIASALVLVIYL